MRRFFIKEQLPPDLALSQEINITGDDARHIAKVLRLGAGDEIIVSLKGWGEQAAKAVITKINTTNSTYVTIKLKEKFDVKTEPPVKIWLGQSLPKSDKMDFIVQKAVELGVTGIIPLITRHCVAKYDTAKKETRLERWQKISQEAAKQCGRSHIPPVMPVTTLEDLFKNRNLSSKEYLEEGKNVKVLMLYEGQTLLTFKAALDGHCTETCSYLLIVGPEGGFSLEEVNLCKEQGAGIVGMGPRILRTETAALAAVSILMYQCGDLGGS